jgi:hypothetical protein
MWVGLISVGSTLVAVVWDERAWFFYFLHVFVYLKVSLYVN